MPLFAAVHRQFYHGKFSLKMAENKMRDIFNQCLVLNKTIIPVTFVGYELMIADSYKSMRLDSLGGGVLTTPCL